LRLLLDTNILIWAAADSPALPAPARKALANPRSELYVSVASAWEIAIKVSLGKLVFPVERMSSVLDDTGCILLPIGLNHAIGAAALPKHHSDPFDRMLISQAQQEGLVLLTADSIMTRYDVPLYQGE
jgi:PIN domain nuclease of toxin-antitoxin system